MAANCFQNAICPLLGSFGTAADFKVSACYPAGCAATSGPSAGVADSARTNINSTTRGNVGILDPSTTGRGPNDLPGLHNHNLNLALLAHVSDAMLLRDVANLDFRPLPTGLLAGSGVALIDTPGLDASTAIAAGTGVSNDIGAYDMQSSFYWIPGRQVAAASSPVPPHNATNVRPNADLMFLGGLAPSRMPSS